MSLHLRVASVIFLQSTLMGKGNKYFLQGNIFSYKVLVLTAEFSLSILL